MKKNLKKSIKSDYFRGFRMKLSSFLNFLKIRYKVLHIFVNLSKSSFWIVYIKKNQRESFRQVSIFGYTKNGVLAVTLK